MISRLRERLTALRGNMPSSEKMNEGLGRWLAQKTFSTADRLTLYEDLAFLLDNNLKVEKAINSMIGSYGNKRPRWSIVWRICSVHCVRADQSIRDWRHGYPDRKPPSSAPVFRTVTWLPPYIGRSPWFRGCRI